MRCKFVECSALTDVKTIHWQGWTGDFRVLRIIIFRDCGVGDHVISSPVYNVSHPWQHRTGHTAGTELAPLHTCNTRSDSQDSARWEVLLRVVWELEDLSPQVGVVGVETGCSLPEAVRSGHLDLALLVARPAHTVVVTAPVIKHLRHGGRGHHGGERREESRDARDPAQDPTKDS